MTSSGNWEKVVYLVDDLNLNQNQFQLKASRVHFSYTILFQFLFEEEPSIQLQRLIETTLKLNRDGDHEFDESTEHRRGDITQGIYISKTN